MNPFIILIKSLGFVLSVAIIYSVISVLVGIIRIRKEKKIRKKRDEEALLLTPSNPGFKRPMPTVIDVEISEDQKIKKCAQTPGKHRFKEYAYINYVWVDPDKNPYRDMLDR